MTELRAETLARRMALLPPKVRRRSLERLALVVSTLEQRDEPGGTLELLRRLSAVLDPVEADRLWLAVAVLSAEMPVSEQVLEAMRIARLDGPLTAMAPYLAPTLTSRLLRPYRDREVEVVQGGYVIDVEETSRSSFSTGIQRVARSVAGAWSDRGDVTLVGWHPTRVGFRRLTAEEQYRTVRGTELFAEDQRSDVPESATVERVLIPWRTNYILPELTLQPPSLHRLSAFARFGGSQTCVIGFDCVPVTSAETVDFGVAGGFAGNLSAIKFFDRVAAISDAAAVEYEGWRRMLAGSGLHGPRVESIELPVEAVEPSQRSIDEIGGLIGAGDRPIVLCVGSHEPRKNHLAVLHAAELAWAAGHEFSLVFVGGNSWRSQAFQSRVAELTSAGRPVSAFTAVSDDLLWAAYKIARVVMFPSFNEGFGLPVAEALALGTPVITSNYGSLEQIARRGGAVLVDPRDDHSVAAGLIRVLSDEAFYSELRRQAAARPERTWAQYAAETWDYFSGQPS